MAIPINLALKRSLPVPDNVNWRGDDMMMNPIKNQPDTGTSWICASVSCVEAWYTIHTGNLVGLSVQQLIDLPTYKCGKGDPPQAFQHMMGFGVSLERDYPLTGRPGIPQYHRKAVNITGYGRVPENDEDALMWAVAHGPIVAAIEADEEFMRNSTGEYGKHSREPFLNHYVLVIGYGTTDEGNDYWIIQNSQGDTWGKHGCATMPRNKTLESGYCNLAKYAFYPTMSGVVPPFVTPPPQAISFKPCNCEICLS